MSGSEKYPTHHPPGLPQCGTTAAGRIQGGRHTRYKVSDKRVNFGRISVSRQMSPGRQIDVRRSAAVGSSAETALTIDTENFTADVTRRRKHNFHIGLSNERLYDTPLSTTEKVSICYNMYIYPYILYGIHALQEVLSTPLLDKYYGYSAFV